MFKPKKMAKKEYLALQNSQLKPFKNWFCDVEKYFLQSYTVEDPNLIDTVFENLN